MHKSELVRTVKKLSKAYREKFMLFLNSPYCTGGQINSSAIDLMEYIISACDNDVELLEEKKAYQELYPNKEKVTQHDLSNLRSVCLKHLKKFMVQEQFSKDMVESGEHLWLSRFYAEQGFQNYAERELSWLADWQSTERLSWNDRDFLTSLQVSESKSYYLSKYSAVKGDIGLPKYLQELHFFFMHMRVKYTNLLFATSNVSIVEFKEVLQQLKIDFGEEQFKPYFETPLGSLFKMSSDLIDPFELPDYSIYKAFITELDKNRTQLSPHDTANFDAWARNYLVRKYASGSQEVLPEIFELQKKTYFEAHKNYKSKYISSLFVSTIRSAVVVKKMDWARDFYSKQKENIRGSQGKINEGIAYCSALIDAQSGNWDAAMETLLSTNFSDEQIKCFARTLEIQILFKSEPDLVDSRLRAAKMFFRRNDNLNEERKTGFINFLNVVKRMMNPKFDHSEKKVNTVYEYVKNEPILYERFWLIETLEEKLQKWNKNPKTDV